MSEQTSCLVKDASLHIDLALTSVAAADCLYREAGEMARVVMTMLATDRLVYALRQLEQLCEEADDE